MTAGDLVARADRALMCAKRSGRRGEVLTEADLPPTFAPGRARCHDRIPTAAPHGVDPRRGRRRGAAARLARQLAQVNRLRAALTVLGTVEAIEAAVVAALQEEFGYTACAVLRAGPEASSRTRPGPMRWVSPSRSPASRGPRCGPSATSRWAMPTSACWKWWPRTSARPWTRRSGGRRSPTRAGRRQARSRARRERPTASGRPSRPGAVSA